MKEGYKAKRLIAMFMTLALVIGCLSGLESWTKVRADEEQDDFDYFSTITIDGQLDDWQVIENASTQGTALEYVKTVKSGNKLYVAIKTADTPEKAPEWYIGFNADGDTATGYADYSGVEYCILGDSTLYKNTDPNGWLWEEAADSTFTMATSEDGSVVELVVGLDTIGQSKDMSVFVLGVVNDWDYLNRSVPVLSYHKAIGASVTWDVAGENAHKFTNAGSDGAYLSDITQENTTEGLKATFTMANYKKSRFWTEFDSEIDLSTIKRLLVSYSADGDITFKGLTARIENADKSDLYKIPVTKLANGLFSVDLPEGATGSAKYIRWYWEGMDSDMPSGTVVTFKDFSFVGIAGGSSEDEGGEEGSASGFAIDGNNDDWRDIRDILDTPEGAFDRVSSVIDDEYFYVMFSVNDVTNWCTLQMFLDTDGNSETGFTTNYGGFEYLIEGASIYKSEAGEWPNTQVGAATVGKSTDGSVYEVRIPLKTLGEGITGINFHIGLVNSNWATAYEYPAGTTSAIPMSEAVIVSDEAYISDFTITADSVAALSAEATKGATIATFSAKGGEETNYAYSFVYSEKAGKDNGRFTISGDKLIVADKMLAPGEYKIYVKVKSGVRYDIKAFSVVVGSFGEVGITEDVFNGNEGEWFAVSYSTANPIPNLTELRAAADGSNLYVYALAQVLSANTKLYISDGVTAGANLSAKWSGASNVAYMVDLSGKIYKYENGSFAATGDTIAFASAVTGFETVIPMSVFGDGAQNFMVAIDDGSGSMLPNAGENMMSVTKPIDGTAPVITQDGDPSEWTDEYKVGVGSGSMGDLWAVRTADYIYAMTYVTVDSSELETEYSYSTNLYIDSDHNTATGYGYQEIYTEAGADFLLQDWYIANPELTYRTGNGTGFGFSHSKGGCGDYLTDWKVTAPTENPNVFCIEYKIPIADLERISGMSVDDVRISVQRDSTVRTSFAGVTKADRTDGVFFSEVPKYGTSFNVSVDGSFTEWNAIPNAVYNTATENVYNIYATTSQYKLYALLSSVNNDLNTQTQFIIDSAEGTGYTYKKTTGADYVVKDGNLYPVIADNKLGDKIKAVDIDYTRSGIALRLYLEDIDNPDTVKIAARALNNTVAVPSNGYLNVSASFIMDYENGYVYPYENFETYNNPYKGWATWANGKAEEVDDIAYDFNLAFFPVTWADIEEEKGVFDWSYVNEKYQLDRWKDRGVRVNFRFVLDTPEPLTGSLKDTTYGYVVDGAFMEEYGLIDSATGKVTEKNMKALVATGNFRMDIPEWLAAELCNEALAGRIDNAGTFYNWPDSEVLGGASFSPNYYSELLQNYHDAIIAAFAEKFDDTAVTGFIQVGSLGHWGEFHTWPEANSFPQYNFGSGEFPDPTTAGRYAESYVKYFKNIKIGLRYPYPFAAKNGFGLFNDVFGADEGTESFLGAIKNGNSVNITNPSGTDIADSKMPDFWKTNYSGGEFSNGDVIRWVDNDSIMQSIEYLKDSHTSWLGPCSPCDLHDGSFNAYTYEGNIKYLQRIMGYRFSVKRVNYVSNAIAGESIDVSIDWRNTGVAPMYYNWPVEVSLLDTNGRLIAKNVVDAGITEWLPESDIHTDISLTIPAGIPSGKYIVAVAIVNPDTGMPGIYLANEGGNDDLRYGLYYITVGAKTFDATSNSPELGAITAGADGIAMTLSDAKDGSVVTVKQNKLASGSSAYLYMVDLKTGELLQVKNTKNSVDKNGTIQFSVPGTGTYVILDREISSK